MRKGDPRNDLSVHVGPKEVGGGEDLCLSRSVPDVDGGTDCREEDKDVGGKGRVVVLHHKVAGKGTHVADVGVGNLN